MIRCGRLARVNEQTTVAAAILDVLSARGIDTAFGIPGVHNLAFWDAARPGRPRIIGVRHEQAAGYAVDGMYRATGRPGAALLTSGPGAGNIISAFGEAYSAYSPLIAIASDVSTGLRRSGVTRGILHEMRDQAAMFGAFGAFARTADSASSAIANVQAALDVCLGAPHQPAYVGIPSDVLQQPAPRDLEFGSRVGSVPLDHAAVQSLATTLRDADRIVVWLGGGVIAAGVAEQVRALVHRLGAIAVTSFAGRGLLADDPSMVQAPVHEPEVARLIAEADLMLVLGSDFDAMNTMNWRMAMPPTMAAITLGQQARNTIDWSILVEADLTAALPLLMEALDEGGCEPREPWFADAAGIRGQVFARLQADDRVASALAFVDALEHGWDQQDAMVCDMAVCGFWAALYSRQDRPRRAQYPVGWGTLGYGLPAAIGPASQGMCTLSVCGDGGVAFAIGELATLAQESLPVTLLVIDDGGYGMLRFDQQVFGHPERGVNLGNPDWVALAASFGIGGQEATTASELSGLLRQARVANAAGEPRLIAWKQRLFPPRTTSPRWFEDQAG